MWLTILADVVPMEQERGPLSIHVILLVNFVALSAISLYHRIKRDAPALLTFRGVHTLPPRFQTAFREFRRASERHHLLTLSLVVSRRKSKKRH